MQLGTHRLTDTSQIPPKMKTFTQSILLLAAVLLGTAANANAEGSVSLIASDTIGNSSFAPGYGVTNWSNGQPPAAGTNYFTAGYALRTPAAGNFTFAGDSLTIQPNAISTNAALTLKGNSGAITTINNCTNAGGVIGNGNSLNTYTIAGNMVIVSNTAFGVGNDGTRFLIIGSALSGTNSITNGFVANGLGTIAYTNNNSAFTGPMVTTLGVTNQAGSQANLGGNPAAFNPAQFVLDNGIFAPTASFAMTNANSGVTINPGGGVFSIGSGLILTISNTVTGPGNLTNSGAGTLLLAGTNTYTGNTFVNAGTLTVGGAGQLGSGSYAANITNNGAFNYNSSASQSISGVIAGTGSLNESGPGALTLSGANTYSGSTTVSGGQLNIGNWGGATLGAITVGNAAATATLNITGGTLSLGGNTFTIASGATSSYVGTINQSAGTVSFTSGTAMLIGNGSGSVGSYNLSGGTLSSGTYSSANRGVIVGVNSGCSATFNLSGSGVLSLPLATLEVGRSDAVATNVTATYNQSGGTATLGYLTIGGYSGAPTNNVTFTVSGGSLVATNFPILVGAASSSANITLGGSAQVTLPAFPAPVGTVNLTFNFTNGYLAPLATSLNYMSGLANVYLTTNGANFNVGSGNNITVGQVFQNAPSQAGKMTKTGAGTLTLSGVNTYSGATTVSAGELVGVTGGSAASSAVAVTPASGVATLGVLYTGGNTQWTCGSLSFNAGGTGTGLEFGFATVPSATTAPLNVAGSLTFGVTPGVTVDVGSIVAGVYPLVVVGGTAPTAVPALNWSPSTRQGTLSGSLAWGGSGFGANTLVLTVTGSSVEPLNWNITGSGTWDVNDSTNTIWKDSASPSPNVTYYQQSVVGDPVVFGDTYITANTTVTLNTNISPASVTFNNSTYNYTNTGAGGITGPTALIKSGTAAVTLSAANTYTGGTTINQGTVNTGVAGGLGASAVTIASAGTLNLTAGGITYTGPSTGISGAGTVNVNTGSGSSSIPLNGANSGFTGVLNVGTNSTGGKVQLNGVLSSSATVNVLSNSTVYVSGPTQPAAITLYGGTPGEAYGQLRVEQGGIWSGPVTLAGPIFGSGVGTIGAVTGTGTISGNIGQTGGAQSLSAISGTLVLSGTNTYTGPTIVNGGTLTLLGNQTGATGGYYVGTNTAICYLNIGSGTQTTPTTAAIASGNTVLMASAGTSYSVINVTGTNGNPTYVTNNGSMSIGRDSGFAVNGYANWLQNGPMTVQANGGYPGNFSVFTNGSFTYAGSSLITNSAPVSSGSANITISGMFTTSQGFYFNDSGSTGYPILTLATGGTLALSTNISQLVVAGGSGPVGQFLLGTNGVVNLGGFNTTLGFTLGNVSGQTGSLVVSGGGKLTLAGKNNYSGATTINDSELVGVTGGNCTNSSVAVSPVVGVSTLGVLYTGGNAQWACSNLTFNAGGTGTGLEFAFNASPSTNVAPLNITSNAVFNATPTVTVDVGNIVAGTYPLMVVGGTAPVAVPALNWSPAARQGTLSGSLVWGGSGFNANTLVLTVTGNSSEPLSWNSGGSGSGTWDINDSTNLIWHDATATPAYYQQSAVGDQVVFDDVSGDIAAPTIVTLNSIVTPASFTVNNSTYPYTISGSGAIAGGTGLSKSGGSTLTLSTVNTYSGNTTISGGGLTIGGAGQLGGGSYAGAITNSGAFTYNSSAAQTLSGVISGTGTLTQQGPGTLFLYGANTFGGGTYINSGTLEMDSTNALGTGAILDNASLSLNAAGTLTNTITGTGTVAQNNTGTTTLSPTNSYMGGTLVNKGTLKIANGMALGTPSGSVLATVASGASLDLGGQLLAATTGAGGGGVVSITGTGISSAIGALQTSAGMGCDIGCGVVGLKYLQLAGNAAIGDSSGDFQLGTDANANGGSGVGSIDGQGYTLTKVGNNNIVLEATNKTALSQFIISAGGVQWANTANNPVGAACSITISNNAYINSWDNYANNGITLANPFTIGAGGAQFWNDHGMYYNHACYNTFSGAFALSNNLVILNSSHYNGGPANVATSGTFTFSGPISGTGGILITNGPVYIFGSTYSLNTVTLSGANTYTGPTLVTNGGLLLSTIQQGGGTYTNEDGAILDVPQQTGYVTVPMSVLALGSSTGAVLSLSRITTFSTTQAPITATNLSFKGTSVIQLPGVAYTISGQYPLIKYITGTNGTGGLALALPSVRGVSAYLSNNVANQSFDLVVNGNNAVTWTGNASANWDITNSINWQTNGTTTTYWQYSVPGDAVLFNDTSSVTNVNLSVGVSPLVITVNNTNNNYSFGGSPITNATALVKTGPGTLTVSNANSFTGGTYINGGTLKLGNNGALNNSSGTVSVYGNGALDFNYQNPTALACTISGAGFNGLGTLVANYTNAAAIYGPGSITLAGSATIGGTNRWDMRNSANTLNSPTNAYSLTKVGAGLIALVGTTVSPNLGNIYLLGGELGYQARHHRPG